VMFSSLVQTTANIKSGRLRALGVGSKERSPVLPDVPPVAEGLPGYEALNWWGIVGPAGLPAPIVEKVHKAVTAAMASHAVQEEFAKQGASSATMSSAEFAKFVASELPKWERVVKEGGIKAE
jgi:tripartite-type tricarboxylate transporter receptor subunit TctC